VCAEFTECIRTECKFSNDDISDDELAELFRAIDADGSGALSSQEFFAAMKDDSDDLSLNFYCFKKSIFELADLYVDTVSENRYVAFLDTVHEEIADEIGGGAAEEIRDAKGRVLMARVNSWSFRLKQPEEITSFFTPGIDGTFRQGVEATMARKAAWLDHLACYTRFKTELGREPEPHEKFYAMSLGQWCNDQRRSYRADALHFERVAKLEKSNFQWTLPTKAPVHHEGEEKLLEGEMKLFEDEMKIFEDKMKLSGSFQQLRTPRSKFVIEDERDALADGRGMSKTVLHDTSGSDRRGRYCHSVLSCVVPIHVGTLHT
jgi:hypothetical protein